MAASIVWYVSVFIMILGIMGGAIYLNHNYGLMSKEILTSQHELMEPRKDSKIIITNVTVIPNELNITVYNNGSFALDAKVVDLYINSELIPRTNRTIHYTGNNISNWPSHYEITIEYDNTVNTGDNITIVSETGKKDFYTI